MENPSNVGRRRPELRLVVDAVLDERARFVARKLVEDLLQRGRGLLGGAREENGRHGLRVMAPIPLAALLRVAVRVLAGRNDTNITL